MGIDELQLHPLLQIFSRRVIDLVVFLRQQLRPALVSLCGCCEFRFAQIGRRLPAIGHKQAIRKRVSVEDGVQQSVPSFPNLRHVFNPCLEELLRKPVIRLRSQSRCRHHLTPACGEIQPDFMSLIGNACIRDSCQRVCIHTGMPVDLHHARQTAPFVHGQRVLPLRLRPRLRRQHSQQHHRQAACLHGVPFHWISPLSGCLPLGPAVCGCGSNKALYHTPIGAPYFCRRHFSSTISVCGFFSPCRSSFSSLLLPFQ